MNNILCAAAKITAKTIRVLELLLLLHVELNDYVIVASLLPPKTTEWIAPNLAVARIAIMVSGISGM